MTKANTVDEYIEYKKEHKNELNLLRDIMLSTELEETVKWGVPYYMIEGKNVIGFASFKSYVGIWFTNGVFLEDAENKLINAQENKTKALRQWRFSSLKEIQENQKLIRNYVLEAIQNQKDGKELKPKNKKLVIPSLLKQALSKDKELKQQFAQLTPGKQREYAEYIAEAKRDTTKQSRLKKISPMVKTGKGLYDKYK